MMTGIDIAEQEAIERIKVARAALGDQVVVLGHHYQRDEVVQFADYMGDSFALSREAAKVAAKYIIFAGVHFMAESAAILGRDDQIVILPDLQAGCSMADMAALDQVLTAWRELSEALGGDAAQHITPVTYMNSAANLKAFVGAHGGVVCTSSNARGVLAWAFGQREKVFFFPDQHLGRNIGKAMGIPLEQMVVWDPFQPRGGLSVEAIRNARIILWLGHCNVHMQYQPQQIDLWREREPGIKIIVHPECAMEVVDKADDSGSTAQIIKAIEVAAPGSKWAIGTEMHLVNRLKNAHPDKTIHLLSPFSCICSTMYRISPAALAHVLEALVEGRVVNQITVPGDVQRDAKLALDRMLAIPK
jgi:quinolinate synthase